MLSEEIDGVYLDLQGKDRMEYSPSEEMKVSIACSGVYENAGGCRTLANKISCAGFGEARTFAVISFRFQCRILRETARF